jgi:hypothetical protein
VAHRSKRPKRPVHRQATRAAGRNRAHPNTDRIEDQELIQDLRRLLRSKDPFAIGQFVSSLIGQLAGTDRRVPPIPMALPAFVETFIDVRIAETTAALHAFAAMTDDELLARRIRSELATRSHPMPDDVTGLSELRVTNGRLMLDPLGDGVDLLLAFTCPGAGDATAVTYIDANLGGIVKDAFIVPEPIDDVEARLTELSDQQALPADFIGVSPAEARAILDHGIAAYDEDDRGAPPSDTWPHLRAFLAALARTLPIGGSIPDEVRLGPADLTFDELDALEEAEIELAHDFLASPEAGHLTGHDALDHEIAHVLATFARAIGSGDPLRWSPPTVEIALNQTLPAMLSGEPDEYARVPTVLRAFIRYAHAEREVSPTLTLETLEVVDRFEGAFLDKRDSPEVVAARAELAAAFEEIAARSERSWVEQRLLDELGSPEAISSLDTQPLPDETLDLTSVPDDIHERVCRVAGLVDQVAERFFDVEIRTACRRLLSMVAANDPAIFRRRSKDETAAAAIVWIIGQANDDLGAHRGGVSVGDMMDSLGLKGTPSQRAEPMLTAIGLNPHRMYGEIIVGTPRLLTSRTRATLLRLRDS